MLMFARSYMNNIIHLQRRCKEAYLAVSILSLYVRIAFILRSVVTICLCKTVVRYGRLYIFNLNIIKYLAATKNLLVFTA